MSQCPWISGEGYNAHKCIGKECELWNPGGGPNDPGECSIKSACLFIAHVLNKANRILNVQFPSI